MKVIGVDPGTLVTGYGVVSESRGKRSCHGWGVIRTTPKALMPLRLKQIADGMRGAIEQYGPDELSLEESFVAKDARAALKIGQARGVIMLVAEQMGLPVAEYSPLKVKQTLVGYGMAEKEQVRVMVRQVLSLKENPSPLDASDALALAITHLAHISHAVRAAK